MSEQVEATFKSLLEELFQLDKPDLDFGIYRILNLKSKEVKFSRYRAKRKNRLCL